MVLGESDGTRAGGLSACQAFSQCCAGQQRRRAYNTRRRPAQQESGASASAGAHATRSHSSPRAHMHMRPPEKKISRHLAAAPFAVLHAHALQAAATTLARLLFCIQCGNAPITARRTIRARPDPVTRLLAVSRALIRRRSPGDAFASIVFSPRVLLLAARPQSPPGTTLGQGSCF